MESRLRPSFPRHLSCHFPGNGCVRGEPCRSANKLHWQQDFSSSRAWEYKSMQTEIQRKGDCMYGIKWIFSNLGSSLSVLFHSLVNDFLRDWIWRIEFGQISPVGEIQPNDGFFHRGNSCPRGRRVKARGSCRTPLLRKWLVSAKCGNMAYINFWAVLFTLFLFWRAALKKRYFAKWFQKAPKGKMLGWVAGPSTGLEGPMERRPRFLTGPTWRLEQLCFAHSPSTWLKQVSLIMAERGVAHGRRRKL